MTSWSTICGQKLPGLTWQWAVLGSRPLQVIKCRALTGDYVFYVQVEAPEQTCSQPPPLVNIVHREPVSVPDGGEFLFDWMLWLGQFMAFIGLLGGGFLVVIIAWIVAVYVLGMFWGAWVWSLSWSGLFRNESQVINTAQSEGTDYCAANIEEDASLGWHASNTSRHGGTRGAKVRKSIGQKISAFLLGITGCILGIATLLICVLAALGLLATLVGPIAAAVCWNTNLSVERAGPMQLPDPNWGLNQHLNLTLELCTTPNVQFYVACSGNATCEQLGEPYGNRLPVGEPFEEPWEVRAGCPKHLGPLVLDFPISLVSTIACLLLSFLGCMFWADASDRKRRKEADDAIKSYQETATLNALGVEQEMDSSGCCLSNGLET